jgi:cell division protein FtsB
VVIRLIKKISFEKTIINLSFGLGILVTIFGIFNGEVGYKEFRELQKSKVILEKAVEGLEKNVSSLEYEIKKIKNSPAYAKRVLKDKYHYKDAGEELIFLPD